MQTMAFLYESLKQDEQNHNQNENQTTFCI
jgi:hypothetical protein